MTYRYAECGTAGESGNADAGVDTDSGADTNADADECAADEHAAVRIANLAVDGRPIADDDLVIIASNFISASGRPTVTPPSVPDQLRRAGYAIQPAVA